MSSNGDIELRTAREDDLPGIFKIYNYKILNSTVSFYETPRTEEEQEEFFTAHDREIYAIFVAEKTDSKEIVAWARLNPYWFSRTLYPFTSSSSIYVDSGNQRRGIGKMLLDKLISHAETVDIRSLIAVITDENEASVRFHEAAGFVTVGVLKEIGFKFGRLLDRRLMKLHMKNEQGVK